jgi:HSP20 family molecular chaperone IbpA
MITLFKDPIFQGLESAFETNRFMRTPETKISKTETEYKVEMGVPGLTKEDLKITTKEGILRISPDDVKEKDIIGKVENGVLVLTLPIDKKKSIERFISLN